MPCSPYNLLSRMVMSHDLLYPSPNLLVRVLFLAIIHLTYMSLYIILPIRLLLGNLISDDVQPITCRKQQSVAQSAGVLSII